MLEPTDWKPPLRLRQQPMADAIHAFDTAEMDTRRRAAMRTLELAPDPGQKHERLDERQRIGSLLLIYVRSFISSSVSSPPEASTSRSDI